MSKAEAIAESERCYKRGEYFSLQFNSPCILVSCLREKEVPGITFNSIDHKAKEDWEFLVIVALKVRETCTHLRADGKESEKY